jgi:hypothetical protein
VFHVTDGPRSYEPFSSLSSVEVEDNPLPVADTSTCDFFTAFSDVPLHNFPWTEESEPLIPLVTQSSEDLFRAEVPETSISSESTTLCSVAFSLVMSNNRKGYNSTDLDVKLSSGYIYNTAASGGCRIQNNILFSVLAEIS